MAEREIIREYLASLGFQVEETDLKKFLGALTTTCRHAAAAGASVAGVAVAAEAMVQRFSHSMEKLYYASKRTRSSVGEIRALEFGSEQVGVAADNAREALEGMAAQLRMNPGTRALLDTLLGRHTNGEDTSKNMIELVKRLSKMPHWIGAGYAEMFGLDEKTFLMLKMHMGDLEKAQQRSRDMYRAAGIDQDKAAAAGREYANTLREIWAQVGVVSDRIAISMLPAFQTFSGTVREVLTDLSKVDFGKLEFDLESLIGFFNESVERLKAPDSMYGAFGAAVAAMAEYLGDAGRRLMEFLDDPSGYIWRLLTGEGKKTGQPAKAGIPSGETKGGAVAGRTFKRPGSTDYSAQYSQFDNTYDAGQRSGGRIRATPTSDPKAMLDNLDKQFGLPIGTLYGVWGAESNYGDPNFMRSKKGALGHMGIMPPTAKEFGVQNPYDLQDSATGMGRKLSGLLKHYGNMTDALRVYNMGEGEFAKYKLGNRTLPKETEEYPGRVESKAGAPILNQTNNVTIHGTGDPEKVSEAVGLQLRYANGDMLRNMQGALA
jgi:hypothetical protein